MEWSLRAEHTGNRLTDLHQTAFQEVGPLYDGQDPRDIDTYRQRAEHLCTQFSAQHRGALVDTVARHMLSLGASPASMQQLERLRDPQSVAVVTGQQAGLLTGPLYSVYKALSAIGAAERLEAKLGRPVVPVFWVASEDHDWGEVDHAYVLGQNDDLLRLKLRIDRPLHEMVYHTQVPVDAMHSVLSQLSAQLPESQYKQAVLAVLRDTYYPNITMSNWFATLLSAMVAPKGLVMVDPCLPGLRGLVSAAWTHAIAHQDELSGALDEAYAEVEQAGFEPAVIRDKTHTTLFYVENGQRHVLERTDNGTLRVRGRRIEKSVSEWQQVAAENPNAFSSNVLLRPVVQDYLLPTLAYVGGPAEIAYHALARASFRVHGRPMPPLIHRDRVRFIPPTVKRHMEKWALTLEHLTRPLDVFAVAQTHLESPDFAGVFANMASEAEDRWTAWTQHFSDLGPQVKDIAAAQLRRELAALARVRRKTEQLFTTAHDAEIRQLQHVNRWLWTDGAPQERRLSPINMWAKYGLQWLVDAPFWGDLTAACGVYDVYI